MNLKNLPPVLFITGTGTDVGKSYATGWFAKEIRTHGESCITQKLIQTGNVGYSEDIDLHRRIMGISPTTEDKEFITCPVIYSYPASPDLAARLDKKETDFSVIEKSTEILASRYDHVLIEGAGGIMVPIKGEYLMADYITSHNLPTVVVISGQLGSINHALLTLKVVESYGINLYGVIYNPFFDKDEVIVADTRKYLKEWLGKHFHNSRWIDMPQTLD